MAAQFCGTHSVETKRKCMNQLQRVRCWQKRCCDCPATDSKFSSKRLVYSRDVVLVHASNVVVALVGNIGPMNCNRAFPFAPSSTGLQAAGD